MYRYTYDPTTGQLKIKMPTQIHGMALTWAAQLIAEGVAVGAWGPDDLELVSEGQLRGFAAQYHGM